MVSHGRDQSPGDVLSPDLGWKMFKKSLECLVTTETTGSHPPGEALRTGDFKAETWGIEKRPPQTDQVSTEHKAWWAGQAAMVRDVSQPAGKQSGFFPRAMRVHCGGRGWSRQITWSDLDFWKIPAVGRTMTSERQEWQQGAQLKGCHLPSRRTPWWSSSGEGGKGARVVFRIYFEDWTNVTGGRTGCGVGLQKN
jgi:hypothetical protein